MKKLAVAVLMLSAACTSTMDDAGPEPVSTPQVVTDPALTQSVNAMQTQLTELLERMDVMNSRLSQVESGAVAAPAVAAAAPAQAPARPVQQAGTSQMNEARRGFEAVFESDSGGELADNALFWIGETYFAAGDLNNAVRYYTRVVNEYSDQNKAPDAMFKTALAQAKTGDLALARRTLQQVIERYPYSSTASSAKAELQRIKY